MFLQSLFARLSTMFMLIILVLAVTLLYLSQIISERYGLEVMQCLNRNVAMYINEQSQLIDENMNINTGALDQLASQAMILNPGLEIYLLDKKGTILTHRLPEGSVTLPRVSLQPIHDYLSEQSKLPIIGDDPRNPNRQKVFSVSPIVSEDKTVGYVYVVIGGQLYQEMLESVNDGYLFRLGSLLILVCMLAAGMAACVVSFFLTRRLSTLRNNIQAADLSFSHPDAADQIKHLQSRAFTGRDDEVGQLARTFGKMANHIHTQFQTLQLMDNERRELIANVSHDLRTPLASMQGYVETLLIKDQRLNDEQRVSHLNTVIRHCKRLSGLIAQLFELSRLESAGADLKVEPFPLIELINDCVQEFELKAQSKQISMSITDDSEINFVVADIALIHRVIQNLVENALEHTPNNGKITFSLKQNEAYLYVEIADTGSGISRHEIPYIFDRHYQAQQRKPSDKIGSGLGLAIVKRILELHDTHINVVTQLSKGTAFSFRLPLYMSEQANEPQQLTP